MRIATRLLALASLVLGIGSTLLSYSTFGDTGYTYWELFQRWDIVTLGLSAMLCVSVVIALGNPGRPWDLLVAASLAFVFTNYAPFAVEYNSGTPAGLVLGAAAGGLSLVAGILLLAEGAGAPRAAAYRTVPYAPATHATTTFAPQPPRLPQSPAAGWYPDPGGSRGQRYWDGSTWTNDLRS